MMAQEADKTLNICLVGAGRMGRIRSSLLYANPSATFSVVDLCGWHVFLIITPDFSYFRLRLLFLAIAFTYVYASLINLLYSECE